MKSLAIASQKGGVGKTTVALNLAYAFAMRQRHAVLIDTDPQGAIGLSLVQDNQASPGLASLVLGNGQLTDALIQTNNPYLSILPVGKLRATQTPALADRLISGSALSRLSAELGSDFDLAIIDTPSGFTGITLGALRASDFVLSPLQAEPIAARSLSLLLSVIGELRMEGCALSLAGVVLSMLQLRNDHSLAVAQEVWNRLPEDMVFDTHIPRDRVFLAASEAGVPLGLLSRKPPPMASVFDQLAVELDEILQLSSGGDDDGPIALIG